MTASANDRVTLLSPSTGATTLSWDFHLTREDALTVVRTRDGDDTTFVLGVDYTFPSGLGTTSGGTLTLDEATEAGDTFKLVGSQPLVRISDFSTSSAFSSSKLNDDLDYLTRSDQELGRDVARAWKAPYGSAGKSIALISEGRFWKADADGNMVDGGDADDIAGAQTAAATATTKAAEAAASAAAAAASAAEAEGDVTGPASSVDSQLAVFSGTSGKTLKVGADTEKSTPIDADRLPLIDSAATNALKWLSLTNLWTWIKAKADTFYQALDAQLSSLIRQNSQSAAYTLVLTDGGKHIFHPSADTTARIWTIPANASVAYPIGTAISFVNQNGAGVITIAITSDTMRLAGAGTTGSRTLAANGIATAVKVTSTEWIISGSGLT